MPVLELAEREVRRRQLIPKNLTIKWIPYDDKCDASYATISAMDGYGDCGHVLFGPTCDYSLGNAISLFVFHFFPHFHVPLFLHKTSSIHNDTQETTPTMCVSRDGSLNVIVEAKAYGNASSRCQSTRTHACTHSHTHEHIFRFIDHKLINCVQSWCIGWGAMRAISGIVWRERVCDTATKRHQLHLTRRRTVHMRVCVLLP